MYCVCVVLHHVLHCYACLVRSSVCYILASTATAFAYGGHSKLCRIVLYFSVDCKVQLYLCTDQTLHAITIEAMHTISCAAACTCAMGFLLRHVHFIRQCMYVLCRSVKLFCCLFMLLFLP